MKLIAVVVLCLTTALAVLTLPAAAAADWSTPSMYAWDFSKELGSVNWWNLWYPQCGLPNQSPIDIVPAVAVHEPSKVLTVRTVPGTPIPSVNAIVAYNSSFNVVRCDLSMDETHYNIFWDRDKDEPSKPVYTLEQLSVRFPSEHEVDGELLDLELRYNFVSEHKFNGAMVIDDVLDDTTTISLIYLFKQVLNTDDTDPHIERLLTTIMNGYPSGTSRVLPYFPPVETMYHYKGTGTVPPCRANTQTFVSTEILKVDTMTIHKLTDFGPNWEDYRTVVPLGNDRQLTVVSLKLDGIVPVLRKTPGPVRYTLKPLAVNLSVMARWYAVYLAGGTCGLMAALLLVHVARRFSYTVPYNLTWRIRGLQGREVFGVPLRYLWGDGKPQPDPNNFMMTLSMTMSDSMSGNSNSRSLSSSDKKNKKRRDDDEAEDPTRRCQNPLENSGEHDSMLL